MKAKLGSVLQVVWGCIECTPADQHGKDARRDKAREGVPRDIGV